jgi:hypothetical protein
MNEILKRDLLESEAGRVVQKQIHKSLKRRKKVKPRTRAVTTIMGTIYDNVGLMKYETWSVVVKKLGHLICV